MELKLFNTLKRQKDVFKPLTPGKVGMYVCGITPYDDAHIGHARVYVVFDVLFRLLRHIYGAENVVYVRNFTDIDDKIIQRAAERGEEPTALAQKYIDSFHADMAALGCLPPTHEPRVSTSIQGIVGMVDELVEKGFAYVTPSGDVMYRTSRFPAFGALARRKIEEQQHGARVKVDKEKEAASDFVLWKANAKSTTKLEQAFAPQSYGAKHFAAEGRPGWHIECSVMSKQHLGPVFDIHGGGEDLMFPHHCCEIAQSEALLAPGQNMAQVWLHNSFITVNGTKMSKSLGNFTTIKDALKKYSPEAIRLWLLQTHYRKPVDYSEDSLKRAHNSIESLYNTFKIGASVNIKTGEVKEVNQIADYTSGEIYSHAINKGLHALCNDLDTPKFIAELFYLRDETSFEVSGNINYYKSLLELARMVGILIDDPKKREENKKFEDTIDPIEADMYAIGYMGLIEKKDYEQAEQIKTKLMNNGYVFMEINDSVKFIHIEEFVNNRYLAKKSKNWAESDRIRDELKAQGILLEDHPDGTTTWRRA